MKIKSLHKSTMPKKLLILAIILVVLVSTFFILEATGTTHFLNPSTSKTTEQRQEDVTNTANKQKFINGNTPSKSSTATSPTSNDISLSAHRETDGSVTVMTQLKNYSDGTCDLTIKNGKDEYTQTASVLYQSSYSACRGFSVPSTAVPTGTWQISLAVTSKGKVNTKTISLEVR